MIYEGDIQYTVEKKCGESQAKKTISTAQTLFNEQGAAYGYAPLLVEVWIYQKSANDFCCL